MRPLHAFVAAMVATACAGTVQAAEPQKAVPAALDPAKAYILVRLGERAPGLWNLMSIAAYDDKVEDLRGKGRAKRNAIPKGADRAVVIGPKSHLSEEDHVRTYLVAVTPGRYVIASSPTTSYCLGSYQFDAVAGHVTDMGVVYIGPENGTSSWAALSHLRSSPDIEERGYTIADALAVYPWKEGMASPSGIEALPKVAAVYRPARRFGNHSGQLLNRVLPLDVAK